ncbi:TonB-dependent receptor plug domain-containing protein [Halioxenophilus sp. WMMB6]|uniref:TonB-dependent receptor plug domain-containing protein n=1 Tax=Halioxenophilus sp. WMMB6 TaxID=3073815 RepID=UPI00295F432D|nr:TonB-dependent receptor plug domain-containing protein [Halioxenophilus sp. WMMB6]
MHYKFNQRRLVQAISAAATIAVSVHAYSQEQEIPTSELPKSKKIEEVIVEGSRMSEGISDLAIDVARFGTQVQIINSEEIATGGFTNFGELAAGLIRGANIGYSPDEGEFTIRLDGGTDRDTLLLLDGVPTFDRGTPLESLWGATAIDPRMIENVEVYRGGQSLYFGGNGGLGVVNVLYKRPEAGQETKGEIGFYGGSFKTREMYGNVSMRLFDSDEHAIMFFARSYETDAHTLFDREAHVDTVRALGGFHDFPYSYNLLGVKYVWQMNDDTSLRLGYQHATIDFRDSFPDRTVFQPNYTEFPIYDLNFESQLSDSTTLTLDAYYTAPTLKNSEVDVRVCNIPRVRDLPADIQQIAADQGITEFTNAAQFEAFADGIDSLPAGCVTNPDNAITSVPTGAATSARTGFLVDENGNPYGTVDNPFPIGAPIGYVIQSTASFGDGSPTKGFGEGDQYKAGYVDYGLNTRVKTVWNDTLQTVFGFQNITYFDNSAAAYGMTDDKVESNGIYADVRLDFDILAGSSFSLAGRQDFNNAFEDEFIWKFGFRQEFGGGYYARANGGTSYSNPTLTEIGARENLLNNPDLETQGVDTYSLGLGLNGEALGGTYNVEVGYFNTEIDNQFGSARLENVCPDIAATNGTDLVDDIVRPTSFCNYASNEFEAGNLSGRETAYFNYDRIQEIEGYTIDVSFDFDQWQLDFTYTDMESLESNPIYGLTAIREGTGESLDFVVPGAAGASATRQSSERPEWSASALLTYTPTERWALALNPTWQGPEWAYAGTTQSRLVDESGQRVSEDLNFGDYFVLNASVQYFMGKDLEHRFLLRMVNITDEDYFERASASATQRASTAGVRGEVGIYDQEYYYQYGWNGKPRSFWLQYEYRF